MAGHGHGLASASSLGSCFHGEIGPFRQTEEIGEKRRARAGGRAAHARRRTPDPRRLAIRACFTTEGGREGARWVCLCYARTPTQFLDSRRRHLYFALVATYIYGLQHYIEEAHVEMSPIPVVTLVTLPSEDKKSGKAAPRLVNTEPHKFAALLSRPTLSAAPRCWRQKQHRS